MLHMGDHTYTKYAYNMYMGRCAAVFAISYKGQSTNQISQIQKIYARQTIHKNDKTYTAIAKWFFFERERAFFVNKKRHATKFTIRYRCVQRLRGWC